MSSTKRVLIVDDDRDCQEILAFVLGGLRIEVATASNGEEALAALRSTEPLPDLIFLDLMMPVMDGEAFRAHQLADARLSRIPTAILSASTDAPGAAERMKTDVLFKPIPVADILDLIRRVLGVS